LFALLCLHFVAADAACPLGVQAQIEQWIEFSTHDIDAPLQSWVMPVRGRLPYDKKVPPQHDRAQGCHHSWQLMALFEGSDVCGQTRSVAKLSSCLAYALPSGPPLVLPAARSTAPASPHSCNSG